MNLYRRVTVKLHYALYVSACFLFCDAFSTSDYISLKNMITDGLERIWKEAVMA
jgi:hypothetical protein